MRGLGGVGVGMMVSRGMVQGKEVYAVLEGKQEKKAFAY
jgi:hypothetical protein